MSSLLLCADERLLPPPIVPRSNISCVAPQAASAEAPEEPEMRLGEDSMRTPSGPERLREVAVRVGQVVDNLYDGTRGVVVAWHLPPDGKLLEAAGWAADTTCHCLVMAAAGQLPVVGTLESGTL